MKLGKRDHETLALWASDCAEQVLPRFEKERPEDDRPRKAIEAGRAWARGELSVGEAQAAAREADGHAAATAHVASHAAHAAADPTGSVVEERERQHRRLPEHLRPAASPARGSRSGRRRPVDSEDATRGRAR